MSDQQCYPETSKATNTKATNTGCCKNTYALKKACFVATKMASGKYGIASGTGKAEGCMYSNSMVGETRYQRQYNTFQATTLGGTNKWSDWPLAYVKVPDIGLGPSYDIEISVRHAQDPFKAASNITDGCTSGSMGYANKWDTFGDEPPDSAQCFGLTPGQMREIAGYLFVVGALFSIVPCGVFCFVLQSSKSKKRRAGQQQNYAPSHQTQGGVIMLAGPQNGMMQVQAQPQQVQVIVQQPQPIVVQAQAVPVPVQQPMAVPAYGNGGDATFISSK